MINPRQGGLPLFLGVVWLLMFLAIVLAAGLSFRAIEHALREALALLCRQPHPPEAIT